jgi:hypothetical protein
MVILLQLGEHKFCDPQQSVRDVADLNADYAYLSVTDRDIRVFAKYSSNRSAASQPILRRLNIQVRKSQRSHIVRLAGSPVVDTASGRSIFERWP